MSQSQDTPYGFCQCGCGEKTTISKWAIKRLGVRAGEPMRFVRGHNQRLSIHERYEVDGSGCWLWTGPQMNTGYGQVSVLEGGRRVTRLAHRWAYEQLRGTIPDGKFLDHLCRTPLCINPDHLEPVAHKENVRRGSATRLTAEQVAEIKANPNVPNIGWARRLGVNRSTIANIRAGRVWADVRPEDYGFETRVGAPHRCAGITTGHCNAGRRCQNEAEDGSSFCSRHRSDAREPQTKPIAIDPRTNAA